jgi:hypothetical protein
VQVTAGELDALVEDLVATLDEFNVPKAEQDELLGLLGPMRREIVEVESPETGTPLPEAAHALTRGPVADVVGRPGMAATGGLLDRSDGEEADAPTRCKL